MCSYIVEKARLIGTAKGPNSRWMRVDTANVYYDHPYEAQLDHALCVDFVCEADGGRERVIERCMVRVVEIDIGGIDPHPAARPLGAADEPGLFNDV